MMTEPPLVITVLFTTARALQDMWGAPPALPSLSKDRARTMVLP